MNQAKEPKNKHVFRKLEELNLIDNFLFQQTLSNEDGEEFARILLSTILGKPIRKVRIAPQKSILGLDTDKHGIRLDAYIEDVSDEINPNSSDVELLHDIYDIEPNKTYEKPTLNVTNQDIASIQKIVTRVKHKKEVGINYMKSWEVEKAARNEGYHEGFDEGFSDGFNDGFNDGFSDGTQKMSQLIICLTEADRTDDIIKIAQDTTYRAQLFKEFNL